MALKIGLIYSSVDGHTKKICEAIAQVIQDDETALDLIAIDEFERSISEYQLLVIGASIRYGKHNKSVHEFILSNQAELSKIKTAFFSVNLVARKDEKNTPDTNPYMIKFLKEINWKADFLEVFAGKLDYQSYSFFDSLMIKLIMKFTNGPTSSQEPIIYTNWEKVKNFGLRLKDAIKSSTKE